MPDMVVWAILLPLWLRQPFSQNSVSSCFMLYSPVAYRSKSSLTIGASVSSISSRPPFLTYPKIRLFPSTTLFLIACACPNRTRLDSLRSSSCAIPDIIVSRSSLSSSNVLMLSFWKNTPTPAPKSSRVYKIESSVFLAKRVISFVMIRSNIPAFPSSTMRWKSSRLLVVAADSPSST